MARDWESTFSEWTGRASDAEQTRYENTRDAIREALRADGPLSNYSFKVYAKGSYPNFTNVVRDSDVDIAAELTTFNQNSFTQKASSLTLAEVGLSPYEGSYDLPSFKNDVQRALVAHFGSGAVDRGKKSIHLRATGRGLKADVVPCVDHRTWTSQTHYWEGIRLLDDTKPSAQIINYPQQHYDRGNAKNNRTQRRYKRVVRILKNLENEMHAKKIIPVVPSFLIESAVWNVPDGQLTQSNYWTGRTRAALVHIFNETRTDACISSNDWLEANGIKYLFHPSQSWRYQDLHQFAALAWNYVGFD
jgi:hypothetical protein